MSSAPISPTETHGLSNVFGKLSLVGVDSSSVETKETKPSSVLTHLVSDDQRQLLDTIDRLRSCGLSEELSLPQLVVCGDQSSGKSSVLEALTQIAFPRHDGRTCTRFATEISLRRADEESIIIKIVPHTARTAKEKAKLLDFCGQISNFEALTSELGQVIESAKVAMGIKRDSDVRAPGFTSDILRIEASGPDRPQLTVVDLPGMFRNDTSGGERALVTGITKHFIHQERTICLPVIQAANDIDNQGIYDLVKQADPTGKRTMGIITKPDRTETGSNQGPFYVSLARNKVPRYPLERGWHVLRNRSPEQQSTMEERNAAEEEFFRTSAFRTVQPAHRGINALRSRLGTMLFEHTQQELPGVRNEIGQRLKSTRAKLVRLGPERVEPGDCRACLITTTIEAQRLCRDAHRGIYEDRFFAKMDFPSFHSRPQWAIRRLRATVRDCYDLFAQDMKAEGHTWDVEPARNVTSSSESSDEDSLSETRQPKKLSFEAFSAIAAQEICASTGFQVRGDCNPSVVRALFQKQSENWIRLAEQHIDHISSICIGFMRDVLRETCAADVQTRIWTHYLEAAMNARRDAAHAMLDTVLRSIREHPLDYSATFAACLAEERAKAERARTESHEHAHREPRDDGEGTSSPDRERSTAPQVQNAEIQETLDRATALYTSKLNLYIDSVNLLVVEDNLVRGLADVLSPKWAARLTDAELLKFARETGDVHAQRAHFHDLLAKLEEGDRILQALMPRHALGRQAARKSTAVESLLEEEEEEL